MLTIYVGRVGIIIKYFWLKKQVVNGLWKFIGIQKIFEEKNTFKKSEECKLGLIC